MGRVSKDYEECEAIKAKQLKSGTRSITWIDCDECLYRGRTIYRDDGVPNGYGGRYFVKHDGGKRTSSTFMRDAKAFIDSLIEKSTQLPIAMGSPA